MATGDKLPDIFGGLAQSVLKADGPMYFMDLFEGRDADREMNLRMGIDEGGAPMPMDGLPLDNYTMMTQDPNMGISMVIDDALATMGGPGMGIDNMKAEATAMQLFDRFPGTIDPSLLGEVSEGIGISQDDLATAYNSINANVQLDMVSGASGEGLFNPLGPPDVGRGPNEPEPEPGLWDRAKGWLGSRHLPTYQGPMISTEMQENIANLPSNILDRLTQEYIPGEQGGWASPGGDGGEDWSLPPWLGDMPQSIIGGGADLLSTINQQQAQLGIDPTGGMAGFPGVMPEMGLPEGMIEGMADRMPPWQYPESLLIPTGAQDFVSGIPSAVTGGVQGAFERYGEGQPGTIAYREEREREAGQPAQTIPQLTKDPTPPVYSHFFGEVAPTHWSQTLPEKVKEDVVEFATTYGDDPEATKSFNLAAQEIYANRKTKTDEQITNELTTLLLKDMNPNVQKLYEQGDTLTTNSIDQQVANAKNTMIGMENREQLALESDTEVFGVEGEVYQQPITAVTSPRESVPPFQTAPVPTRPVGMDATRGGTGYVTDEGIYLDTMPLPSADPYANAIEMDFATQQYLTGQQDPGTFPGSFTGMSLRDQYSTYMQNLPDSQWGLPGYQSAAMSQFQPTRGLYALDAPQLGSQDRREQFGEFLQDIGQGQPNVLNWQRFAPQWNWALDYLDAKQSGDIDRIEKLSGNLQMSGLITALDPRESGAKSNAISLALARWHAGRPATSSYANRAVASVLEDIYDRESAKAIQAGDDATAAFLQKLERDNPDRFGRS